LELEKAKANTLEESLREFAAKSSSEGKETEKALREKLEDAEQKIEVLEGNIAELNYTCKNLEKWKPSNEQLEDLEITAFSFKVKRPV
jgi:uncharacterized protein YicC (UPF0701 family)